MGKMQLVYKGLVYPWHCDHMGHMNVMWYVGKFDEATWAFFASTERPSSLGSARRANEHATDHAADWMRLKLKARDNTEVATATAQPPKQIVILLSARGDDFTFGRDHLSLSPGKKTLP